MIKSTSLQHRMDTRRVEENLLDFCATRGFQDFTITLPDTSNTPFDIAHRLSAAAPAGVRWEVLQSPYPVQVYHNPTDQWGPGLVRLRATSGGFLIRLRLTVDEGATEPLLDVPEQKLHMTVPGEVISDVPNDFPFGTFRLGVPTGFAGVTLEDSPESRTARVTADWRGVGPKLTTARLAAQQVFATDAPNSFASVTCSAGGVFGADSFITLAAQDKVTVTPDLRVGQRIFERGRTIAMGEPVDVPYNAGNFFGNSSLVWTVSSGSQVSFQYALVGKMMTIWFSIISTSVSGTGNHFFIVIPGGFLPTGQSVEWMRLVDAGTEADAIVYTNAGDNRLSLTKRSGANLSAAAGNTHVQGRITFPIA